MWRSHGSMSAPQMEVSTCGSFMGQCQLLKKWECLFQGPMSAPQMGVLTCCFFNGSISAPHCERCNIPIESEVVYYKTNKAM